MLTWSLHIVHNGQDFSAGCIILWSLNCSNREILLLFSFLPFFVCTTVCTKFMPYMSKADIIRQSCCNIIITLYYYYHYVLLWVFVNPFEHMQCTTLHYNPLTKVLCGVSKKRTNKEREEETGERESTVCVCVCLCLARPWTCCRAALSRPDRLLVSRAWLALWRLEVNLVSGAVLNSGQLYKSLSHKQVCLRAVYTPRHRLMNIQWTVFSPVGCMSRRMIYWVKKKGSILTIA